MENKKILIAYFSFSGNTKAIAEKIQTQIGGDTFRIETKIQYPADYDETAYGIAKEQHEKGIKPELKDNGDVSSYDIIFVGRRMVKAKASDIICVEGKIISCRVINQLTGS